jgi:hypothetical protein
MRVLGRVVSVRTGAAACAAAVLIVIAMAGAASGGLPAGASPAPQASPSPSPAPQPSPSPPATASPQEETAAPSVPQEEPPPRIIRTVCTDHVCGGCDGKCRKNGGHVAVDKKGHCACTPAEGGALDRAIRQAYERRPPQ